MKRSQLCHGFFESNHPLFANLEYWGLSHFDSDKCHKIGKKSGYVRELNELLARFPVLSDGKNGDVARDFGGALKRLVKKIPAHIKTNRLYLRISKNGKSFVNAPLGEKSIRSRFVKAYSVCGVSNPESLWPHALRAHFTTKLANDMGVSIKETMAAARHTTAEASAMYQTTSVVSEAHRQNALLGPALKNKGNYSLAMSSNSDDDFNPNTKRMSNNSLVVQPKTSRRKRIIEESDEEFSGEDFEKIEEEKPGRDIKFEIRIESSSDEESYCDNMSYDGDKKLPAKNDIVARKKSSVENFSIYTQAQINGYHDDQAKYGDPTNFNSNQTSPTSGNQPWDLGNHCKSTSTQNYSSFTQVQMHGYHEDMENYEHIESARKNKSLYSRRDRNPYSKIPSNPYSSTHQSQNRFSPQPKNHYLSRPKNPYYSSRPKNPYSPSLKNPYSSRPQNHYSSRPQKKVGNSRSYYHQQRIERRVPSERENHFIELRYRLRMEHEERMMSYPFTSDEDEYNFLASSIENERESKPRVSRASYQYSEDRRQRTHEKRRRQSDHRQYY